MQGQRGTVGSFPESFNFDHGSSSANTAIDPQICWNNPVEERLPGYILPADANITYVNPDPRQCEPTNILSLDNTNANTLGANSAPNPQSLNLNAAVAGHGGNNCQVMECHNLFESIEPENEQTSPADGADGTSLEVRRKRKAVERNVGQSSVGAERSMWPPVPNLGGSSSIAAPPEQSSHKNFRLRVNPSNHDSVTHSFSTANAARRPSGSSSQRLARLPVNHSLDLRPATLMDSQNQSAAIHVPALPSLRTAESSNSFIPGDGDTVSQEGSWPIHIFEHPMFLPTPQLVHNLTNSSVSGGNAHVTASRTGSSFVVHPSSWVPDYNAPSQYPQRLSEYVRRSLLSSVGSEPAAHSSHNSSQDVPRHHHPYARLASLAERQGDGVVGFPHSLRTLAAASEGRRRLASELHNILDLMRQGEGLRIEDVMLLSQSVFVGAGDIHDRHRDVRLDVDNMSYEELLALEERIGNVSTGLKEETISSRLNQRRYSGAAAQVESQPCCVCQEEYYEGEGLGTLECGHDFHTECIKQWLMHKNLCPICKMPGLSA